MIELTQLTHRYPASKGPVTALEDVSLNVAAGEMVIVRGPSGSGKSTLLFAAGGMRRPSSGKALIDGQDLYALSTSARSSIRAQHLGFVFQSLNLIPYLNAMDNILLAAGRSDPSASKGRAGALLDELGLLERAYHRPGQLSQGERQRVALARAVLHQPKAILADEPTGNLDPESADTVFKALRRYADQGVAVLVASHATSHLDLANTVCELEAGRLRSAASVPA